MNVNQKRLVKIDPDTTTPQVPFDHMQSPEEVLSIKADKFSCLKLFDA